MSKKSFRGHRAGPPFRPDRRRFITGLAAATGAVALGGCNSHGAGTIAGADKALPNPADSGIDHIVQVMMENRSFDHFLGWVPGADGIQAGARYRNVEGVEVETFHLPSDPAYGYQGCGWADPSHGYDAGRTHFNNGAMDGFLLTGGTAENPADKFPVGYYTADDLPFYRGAAQHFTVCDRYFHGILAQTFPNRMYIHAGETDRLVNNLPYAQQEPSVLPTIWDRLQSAGISCRNYFHDLPTPGLWGPKYASILAPYQQLAVDAALGQLPAVSYIDPFFGASIGEGLGVARDDHPVADIRDGQALLADIYNTLRNSPNWERTLFIVTYDEWGGFYDHVVPPVKPVSDAERAVGNEDGRLGFRIPVVILGPRARRGHVSNIQFDPQSVIDMITWRFGLEPLGVRAGPAITNNLALALDFDNAPNVDAPDFGVPTGPAGLPFGVPFGTPCASAIQEELPIGLMDPGARSRREHQAELQDFAAMCRRYGLIT